MCFAVVFYRSHPLREASIIAIPDCYRDILGWYDVYLMAISCVSNYLVHFVIFF